MNGDFIFIDTNIIIYYLSGDRILSEILDGKQVVISFITELECLGFGNLDEEDENVIRNFLSRCKIVGMNQHIKNRTIELRRKTGLKLPDCIVAASAQDLELSLLTSDTDFDKLTDVKIALYKHSLK